MATTAATLARWSGSAFIKISSKVMPGRRPFPYLNNTCHGISANIRMQSTSRGQRRKRRKSSSSRWLQRHVQDEYVQKAQKEGLVSRSAYKLEQLDKSMGLFRKGNNVLDLGASPGGWSVYACRRIGSNGRLVAVDLLDLDDVAKGELERHGNFQFLQCDMRVLMRQHAAMDTRFDVVLSDMASNTTGDASTDALRSIGLCEGALNLATKLLKNGGIFVGKLFDGGSQQDQQELKDFASLHFQKVTTKKPPASRKGSPERYLVATGFHVNE